MGLGKSKITIDTACRLYERGEIDAALIVAPNGVHRNWLTDEMPAHVPARLRGRIRAAFWETSKAQTKRHERQFEDLLVHDGFPWVLFSYDGLMTKLGRAFATRLLKRRRCIYILDESHQIKTPGAKRTMAIVRSAKHAPYRRILSGTPVAQGPFDLYSQLRFVKPDIWEPHGLHNFALFKQHFGVWFTAQQFRAANGYDPGYDTLVEYRNLDQLKAIVAEVASCLQKDDHLNLPPKVYTKRYVELTVEQRRLYDRLVSDLVATLDDGQTVDASMALTLLLRLQQVVCGYVKTDEGEVRQIGTVNPRLEVVADICAGLSHPAIIWSRFTRDIYQII